MDAEVAAVAGVGSLISSENPAWLWLVQVGGGEAAEGHIVAGCSPPAVASVDGGAKTIFQFILIDTARSGRSD